MAEEEIEVSEPKKKKGGLIKIIIIAVVALIIVIGGVFAYLTFFSGSGSDTTTENQEVAADPLAVEPAKKSNAEAGIMYDLPAFIVNLTDPSGAKYLRVAITVEVPPKNEKLMLEIEQKLPKIKDAIIRILSSKTVEEVSTDQGKISLKNEIERRTNSLLANGRLMDIYLTEFIIQ